MMDQKQHAIKPQSHPRLGVLLADRENSFWTDFKHCFERVAREKKIALECFWPFPNGDPQAQIDKLEELLKSDFDGLIINPLNNSNLVPGICRAAQQKTYILDVGAKTDPDLVTQADPYYVPVRTVDFNHQGRIGATYIAQKLSQVKHVQVAIMEGRASSRQSLGRTRGALAVFSDTPNLEVVFQAPADFNRHSARQQVLAAMTRGLSIDAFFCANDLMALGVADALAQRTGARRPLIVGVDLIAEAQQAIETGRIDASVAFSRVDVARHVLTTAERLLQNKKPSKDFGVESVLITRENLNTWWSATDSI